MTNLGVVIVTYNAADVIRDCLETLFASHTPMKVVVVDNASPDATTATINGWAAGSDRYKLPSDLPFETRPVPKPLSAFELIQSPTNGGFAAGVNLGLNALLKNLKIDRIWVLNPDTLIPPETPFAFATAPLGFSLMGGRIQYANTPHHIQIDAGVINRWTGVTGNLSLGKPGTIPLPSATNADFISGASMVASRQFIEQAGPMPEDYFLYYEEVDWAMQRGFLPLALCPNATVYHRAGTSIGSPTLNAPASAFSDYYKHRARMMFLRKYNPAALPVGYLFGLAKTVQCWVKGHTPQATAILRAINGASRLPNEVPDPRHQPVKRRT